jgi:hypothetical protein
MATPSELLTHRSLWRGAEDLWLDAFIAFNFLCLTGDILLAHSTNHFRHAAEYIPVYVSPAAFALLAIALLSRLRSPTSSAWKFLGHLAGWISILVGIAGVIYHLDSSFFADRTLKSLTYAAPFAAPLAYAGLGSLLAMNRMVKSHSQEWAQWVVFFALGGFAGNFALSLADHAVNGFYRSSEWIPVISSALAVGFLLLLLVVPRNPSYLSICAAILLLQMAVGVAGFLLHFAADLHGPSTSLYQNIIQGAPPFAPLLLPNLAILGLIGILALDHLKSDASR